MIHIGYPKAASSTLQDYFAAHGEIHYPPRKEIKRLLATPPWFEFDAAALRRFLRPFIGLAPSAARLSRRMQYAWIHFARSGDPGHDRLPEWKPYQRDSRATMLFGRDCRPENAPLDQERKLWERWT